MQKNAFLTSSYKTAVVVFFAFILLFVNSIVVGQTRNPLPGFLRVQATITTMSANGEKEYTLVKMQEKNRESALYEKEVNQTFEGTDEVGFSFFKKKY